MPKRLSDQLSKLRAQKAPPTLLNTAPDGSTSPG